MARRGRGMLFLLRAPRWRRLLVTPLRAIPEPRSRALASPFGEWQLTRCVSFLVSWTRAFANVDTRSLARVSGLDRPRPRELARDLVEAAGEGLVPRERARSARTAPDEVAARRAAHAGVEREEDRRGRALLERVG